MNTTMSHTRSAFKLIQCSCARAMGLRALSTTAVQGAGQQQRLMYPVISKEDFGAFKEYSVIHTDRSLNLMSDPFQRVMRDLNNLLKVTYNCDKVAIIPGMCFCSALSLTPKKNGEKVSLMSARTLACRIFFLLFLTMFYNVSYYRIGYLRNGSRGSSVCN
jgi:hypothetical protein